MLCHLHRLRRMEAYYLILKMNDNSHLRGDENYKPTWKTEIAGNLTLTHAGEM